MKLLNPFYLAKQPLLTRQTGAKGLGEGGESSQYFNKGLDKCL
jgi:hypothetical protein